VSVLTMCQQNAIQIPKFYCIKMKKIVFAATKKIISESEMSLLFFIFFIFKIIFSNKQTLELSYKSKNFE